MSSFHFTKPSALRRAARIHLSLHTLLISLDGLHPAVSHRASLVKISLFRWLQHLHFCRRFPVLPAARSPPSKCNTVCAIHLMISPDLIYKCKAEGCSLIIMNEAYTSRTCSCCGFLNPKSMSKAFECKRCDVAVDRDLNGARNIMLKTLCQLRST